MKSILLFITTVSLILITGCGSSDDKKTTADPDLQEYQLTITAHSGGSVQISEENEVSDHRECYDSCLESYEAGTQLRLHAQAEAQFQFQGWQGPCTGTGDCLITLDQDTQINANFAEITPPPPGNSALEITTLLPSSNTVPYTISTIDILSSIESDHTVNHVSWLCTTGCVGNGLMSNVANSPEQWQLQALSLAEGLNIIEISASDSESLSATATITITREAEQHTLRFEAPIGIPDPGGNNPKTGESYGWGNYHPILSEAPPLPSEWSTEISHYYYINPSHPQASDDQEFGTPDQPRISLPNEFSAGSYVVLAGHFSEQIERRVSFSCTKTEPCWLRGASQEDRPSIIGQISSRNSRYLFIENLDFNGGNRGALSFSGIDSHHIAIRNNLIRNRAWDGNSAAISTRPDLGGKMHDIVIYNNTLHDLGDYTVEFDQDFQGFNPSLWDRDATTEQYNLWFLDNTCYRISGDCAQVNAGNWRGSYEYLHHIYLGRNTAWQNRQGNIWLKQARDVIVSQNIAFEMNGGGSGNAGHGFGGQYAKDNIWFIFNEVYDSVFGFRQSSTTENNIADNKVYYIGNLIHNIRPASDTDYDPSHTWSQGTGIALWHGGLQRYVIDNTLYNVYDGINASFSGGLHIYGNIISEKDDHRDNHFFDIAHPGRNNLVHMDYNLFFDTQTESYYSWQNNQNRMESLEEVQSGTNTCLSCLFADPLFNNSEANNFIPLNHSPAVAINSKHPAYDRFENLYGLNIYLDYNAKPRHPTSPTIGAFEAQ